MDSDNGLHKSEVAWRQYELPVGLYKFYLDFALKTNVLYYGITGAILAYVFSSSGTSLIRWALGLPIVMGLGIAAVFLYGSCLLKPIREEVFRVVFDSLDLQVAPDIQVLTVILRFFSCLFILVSVVMFWLMMWNPMALGT